MKEKQIDKQAVEEMAKVIKSSLDGLGCGNFNFTGDEISIMFAKALYNANYRKQSVGEWIWINQAKGYLEPPYGDTCKCSLCEFVIDVSESNYKYCPNCGAKMKGGAE